MQKMTVTDPNGKIVALPEAYNDLTGKALERAIKDFEYDLMEEHLAPYIVDMTKELPEQHPLISIDGSCVCSRGNISAIVGEAKSKKTFLTSALVASAMAIPSRLINNFKNVDKDMNINVLWVDTEQGERHVRKVVERISEMTGAKLGGAVAEPRLTTLMLRELEPAQRYKIMVDTIYHYPLPFDLIVIDGIADLQRNTNDLEESDALVGALMALSTKIDAHIICVLHTNPGSDKARGHLGSSLQRKAESVLFVHRAEDCSIVEPQYCRNEPFERFAFNISEEGIPQLCDLPTQGTSVGDEVVEVLTNAFGGVVERAVLVKKLVSQRGLNHSTAQMRIHRLIDKGVLIAKDNLVCLPSVQLLQPMPEPTQQPDNKQQSTTTILSTPPASQPIYGTSLDLFPEPPF